ncbi:MAG: hypothetical protein GX584_07710 [Clostridiaceae bacterium]|nr:hypothetical protein [Clostridiaceae bacterium]
MRKYTKELLAILIFLVSTVIAITVITNITMPKRYSYGSTWGSYLKEPKNSIDVLFFGSSLVYCNIVPSVIYEHSGITSYVMAGPEQTIPLSYYYIKEAVKSQNPKTIMLDANGMFFNKYEGYTKVNIGYMPWSLNRLKAIENAAEQEQHTGLYFPLYNYHTRWSSLTLGDIKTGVFGYERDIYAGYTFLSKIEPQGSPWPRNEKFDIQTYKENLEYMKDIAAFCEKKGISLIVFISPSFSALKQDNLDMLKKDIGKIKNVSYIDFNERFDDFDINVKTDFFDLMHFNALGAEKFSIYLSDMLKSLDLEATDNEDMSLWWSRISNFKKQKALIDIPKQTDIESIEEPDENNLEEPIEVIDNNLIEYENMINLMKNSDYDNAIMLFEQSENLKKGYEKASLYYAYAKALKYHTMLNNEEQVELLKSHINTDFILTIQYKPVHPYKRTAYGATWGNYFKEPKNSIDVMFFGSSLIYCDIAPPAIYDKAKITSYVMGGPEQTMPITYYYIKEALRTQSPKVIFVEVTGLLYDKYYSNTKTNILYMPKSINRLSATFEGAIPDTWDELLFSLYDYDDDTITDISEYSSYGMDNMAGYTYLDNIDIVGGPVYRSISYNEEEYMLNLSYLHKISKLCEEEKIQLEYFIAPSYYRVPSEYMDIIEKDMSNMEYGRYTDHNIIYPDERIDRTTHFYDILHFNCYGAKQYSDFLAELLVSEYKLSESLYEDTTLWQSRVDNFMYMLSN